MYPGTLIYYTCLCSTRILISIFRQVGLSALFPNSPCCHLFCRFSPLLLPQSKDQSILVFRYYWTCLHVFYLLWCLVIVCCCQESKAVAHGRITHEDAYKLSSNHVSVCPWGLIIVRIDKWVSRVRLTFIWLALAPWFQLVSKSNLEGFKFSLSVWHT